MPLDHYTYLFIDLKRLQYDRWKILICYYMRFLLYIVQWFHRESESIYCNYVIPFEGISQDYIRVYPKYISYYIIHIVGRLKSFRNGYYLS